MTYDIKLEKDVLKSLKKLDQVNRQRIKDAIESLSEDPHRGSLLKGDWQGLWRLRVGRYRLIYAIHEQELVVIVLRLGHRKDVYN